MLPMDAILRISDCEYGTDTDAKLVSSRRN